MRKWQLAKEEIRPGIHSREGKLTSKNIEITNLKDKLYKTYKEVVSIYYKAWLWGTRQFQRCTMFSNLQFPLMILVQSLVVSFVIIPCDFAPPSV